MPQPTYLLVHDIGTTGNKSCLYRISEALELVDTAMVEYPLYVLPNGGVEQHADEWWGAVCAATRQILARFGPNPPDIRGMAFCAQMQGFVPVDKAGCVLRNPMSYMDNRATAQVERYFYTGFPRIGKLNLFKALNWLRLTGGAAASTKDPLWKYLWMRENEPEIFAALHAWLDVKDYLILRATCEMCMGCDSAHATFLYDTRHGKLGWHAGLCRTYDVDIRHMPRVIQSTDVAGKLSPRAAGEMGLPPGIPIFGGGGDLSLIAVGAGCVDVNSTHIYIGTSGWVAATVDRRMTDLDGMVASILGAVPGRYNYISEQETAGRCLQWARDHVAVDEVGIYPGQGALNLHGLYDQITHCAADAPPGADGVIFTPWLHGNRSPFEDPLARGMFFNLGLETSKPHLMRAVLEGVAYHLRWMLTTVEKNIPAQPVIRLVGGGAQSPVWAQILADVTGREIDVMENAQNAGTVGAAIVCAVGLGITDFERAQRLVRVARRFSPQPQNQAVYERMYPIYRALYHKNKALFARLNG